MTNQIQNVPLKQDVAVFVHDKHPMGGDEDILASSREQIKTMMDSGAIIRGVNTQIHAVSDTNLIIVVTIWWTTVSH